VRRLVTAVLFSATAIATLGAGDSTTRALTDASYLCVADLSAGFKPGADPGDSSGWEYGHFVTQEKKYVVRRSAKPGIAWEVRKLGNDTPRPDYVCPRDGLKDGVLLRCYWTLDNEEIRNEDTFKMNARALRFLESNLFGYWLDENDKGTPQVTIGRCSRM
jgi:hypothetical protein